MSKKRTQYSIDFKVRIALAAIRGDETVAQLSARHGIHPTQINSWKCHLIEHAAELFVQGNDTKKESAAPVDDLHRVIGQLTVERDFLARQAQSLSFTARKTMIGLHRKLSKARQCEMLRLPRSSYYYQPHPMDGAELTLLRQLDEQ